MNNEPRRCGCGAKFVGYGISCFACSKVKQRKPDDYNSNTISFKNESLFQVDVRLLADEIQKLLVKKQADYGPKSISDAPGGALNGIVIRMHDKFSRAINIIFKSKQARNESLIDTFMDIAGYSMIAILVLRGKWGAYEKDSRNL